MQKSNQEGGTYPASTTGQTPVSVTPTVLTANQIQALSSIRGQQNAIGVLPAGSGASLPTVITLPRAITAASSVPQALHVSGTSLSNTRLISPQTINIIQRQVPASGIVGLSSVTAQGLQQVLQASGGPLTLVTASPDTAAVLERERKLKLLQRQREQLLQTGSTVHHLGQKGVANPASNQNVSLVANMSSNAKQTSILSGGVTVSLISTHSTSITSPATAKDIKLSGSAQGHALVTSIPTGTTRAASSPAGGPPSKKIKVEEKTAIATEIASLRQNVCGYKYQKMREVKARYREHLTELFYLQGGGNIVEFNAWKKRPTQPLLSFLEGSKLDSEDDAELQEKRINDEVKVLTSAGSNIPIATPVAISTTLPPSVSALSQQAMNSSTTTTSSLTSSSLATVTSSELQQHLSRASDVKNSHTSKGGSSTSQPIATKGIKSQSTSPGRSRQTITTVYENMTGSQDVIERAKQEAKVLQRVNELRKEGLWTAKRLPRVQEPPRQKAHWDYLLEEMTWLAADFIQERKWKKAAAKKIARMVSNYFKEREMKELKAEKEEAIKLKKIASQMSKMVKEFWSNIEKVVHYKQTTRLEEKKKKALDLHLSFIVDQTEKYSSWLTAGLQNTSSKTSSVTAEDDVLDAADGEFQPMETASDDEETIEKEEIEAGDNEDATKKEIEALQKESELPLEEVLKGLPKEMLDEPSSQVSLDADDDDGEEPFKSSVKKKDLDYTASDEEDADEEETLEEQEQLEKKDYSNELNDLKEEGEMSVEELMKKYAGAYDSDFEMPEESSEEEESSDDEASNAESGKESEKSSEEMEEENDDKEDGKDDTEESKKAIGLEYLVEEDKKESPPESQGEQGPGKEFNDIAAAAQSLQPKGYTLETTEVKTKVPFLLKHTLREYQHVGLDWLATMHDKRLNGILADEMGLGKTIQTIALLAHLACEKGIWGPHLIVVPTSVMLNWEMEIKKWCPAFKILTYYGTIKERKLKRQGWTKTNAFHVCVTSYKLVVQDHQAFRRKKWKYFILDEAQNIKNFKSQRWQMLLNFSSQRRLLLTGTPLQNSLMELWSLMHFLMPNVFQSHSEFKEWFSNPLTGMIEGSKEYNESLVRRLHKVLRPFLLRRLKNEVEKQMPQKFEHVVMCRLSKRQRYLYDDFMSQTKTKETLASGHFMSVINILMQLRKVCNHPNLFDPRPVVSPFKMEGIVYNTASLVARALDYDPFRDIDVYSLYPNLSEMETDLPAFVAQRVKQLHAPRKLIEEVDDLPPPEPRPPRGQLKNFKPSAAIAALQQAEQSVSSQPKSSAGTAAKTSPSVNSSQSSSVNSIKLLLPSSSSSSTPQSILIPNPSGSGPSIVLPLPASSSATSSASTASSTSVALAQAKLISSQLQSGVLQLVQTSKGHQVITAASTSNSSSSSTPTSVSTSVSLLKVLPQQKPVMKVSPFVVSSTNETNSSKVSALSDNKEGSNTVMLKASEALSDKRQKPVQRSELFLESLYRKKEERRRHILSHLAKINQQRCSVGPVLGTDSHHCVNCFQELSSSHSIPNSKKAPGPPKSPSHGFTNCLFAQNKTINHFHPDVFWRETSHLINSVHSPEDHLKELENILCRFVFATPSVISPNIQMHISHPDCHSRSKMDWLESQLRPVIQEQSAALHPIQSRTLVQFPEPRLIQYDCGKLQTLDLLLRQLKSGHHRVLIFTQMTKMLDVLEAFLNFHGHRYLRLDGTTKVEQRQYLMDRFNADPRIFCFILSTRSGGIGVNLTGADTVIFYDSDWNPTMDAQAQDRCHRIGQTRDVHIYRLVSEMTVEENILKKANQKRLLGDLAIEGGNFTTAFFKEQTINDLFAEPSGLECLLEVKEAQEAVKSKKEKDVSEKEAGPKKESKKEPNILSQFEQALSKAEDETDAQAVKQVQAEQKAELAEFDESIPWDEREADLKKEEEDEEVSRVEIELAMLDKELTPIERYAVTVMEAQMEPETAEELKMAEEDIENSKKDWELARLKALKEEEERKAELEEDEMLYIYSKDESQVKRGRKAKTPKQKGAKPKKLNMTSPGSDADEGFSPKAVNGRRASERLSPVKSPKAGDAKKAKKVTLAKKKVETGKKAVTAKGRRKAEGTGKKSKEVAVSGNRSLNGPKGKSKGKFVKSSGESEGKKTPVVKSKPKASDGGASEKKEKSVVKAKTPVSLQNGHSPNLMNSKLSTQARNALLKQQSQQASRIIIGKGSPLSPKSPIVATTANSTSPSVSSPLTSPPARLPLKLNTAKSPTIDPNVPPPWSNPNLVIRTRKAAVHSPVVLSRMQRPPISTVAVTSATAAQSQAQRPPQPSVGATPVLQQTLSRLPVTLNTPQNTGVRLQSTPDRNIFQLFNTSGITITPTIRQVAAPAVGQLRTATLINPVSFVNTVNLSGARLITTGGVGLPSSVVVSPTKQPAVPNVAGNMSNITLVPTVINTGRGPTIINQGASAANIVNTGETRTVLNTARLASPITLQSLGGMPVAVNVIKPNTALTVPVRPQILQTTSLAQVAGQSGYVLITPRPRLSVAPTGVTTVQAAPAAPTLQGTRLLLAQMPQAAAVVQQQPSGTNSVNGVAAAAASPAAAAAAASVTVKKDA